MGIIAPGAIGIKGTLKYMKNKKSHTNNKTCIIHNVFSNIHPEKIFITILLFKNIYLIPKTKR